MKRIGIINENIAKGGIDTFLITLFNNWTDKNDQFIFVINDNHPGLMELESRLPSSVKIIKYHGYFAWMVFKNPSMPILLRKFLSLFSQYVLFVLHYIKINKIIRDEKMDVVMVVNGGYPGGDLCRAASITSFCPVIHNFHNLVSPMPLLKRPFESVINAMLKTRVNTFVSVSKACSQSLADFLNVRVVTIYNGLEIKKVESSQGPNRFTCGVVGVLEPRKGHIFLLDVFQKVVANLPQAKLLVYGSGDSHFEQVLIEHTKLLGLESNVEFKGFVSDKEKVYADMDLLIVPSQEYESFGLICVEAMLRKIPVVSTDVGGLPEVVSDHETGFVVSKNDVKAMAERIELLLTDRALREKMGEKGQEESERRFSVDRMVAEYHALIHSKAV